VDGDQVRLDSLEPGRNRLGASRATSHSDGSTPHLILVARRDRDDDWSDGARRLERVERPLQERPPDEGHEGLRAAGSEPFAGAGGRDDR
jgi:hypothetical protein